MYRSKILIIDDQHENILALSELIQANNIEIFSAKNYKEALKILTEHEFCLTLLDVHMPEMNGFELARLIRGVRRYKHMPIIFVTAHSQDQYMLAEGYEIGAVDILFKPLIPSIVLSKVRTFVELDQQKSLLKDHVNVVEKLKRRADSANLAKSQFLANMSHEIRTPLGAILSFIKILQNKEYTQEELTDYLSIIDKNSSHLLRIIDDILDLSKLEAGMLEIDNRIFSVKEILTSVINLMSLKSQDKNIELKFHYRDLPDHLCSDSVRIRQLLVNLIGNAIKFTEKGEVVVDINYMSPYLCMRVSDTGCGMSEGQAKRLFNPFMQADQTITRKYGGTGLGLSLSYEIAKKMEGEIKLIKTEENVGSTFEVIIKVGPPTPALKLPSQNLEIPTGPQDLSHLKVLLVEDTKENRMIFELYLKKTGLQIDTAENGEIGLEKALNNHYDMVFLDIQMPKLDGYEVIRRLRRENFRKPVIALTAHAMKEERARCLAEGFDSFISKPFEVKQIISAIQNFTARS